MQKVSYLYSYVEDAPSLEVAKRLLEFANANFAKNLKFVDGFPSNTHGAVRIRQRVQSLVQMARSGQASLVLTDLDEVACAPSLIREWSGGALEIPKRLLFHVAVKEIESWVLADRAAFARYLGIPIKNFTMQPDQLRDPKNSLLNVIRKKGKKKWLKEMLPQRGSAAIGPLYNEKLCKFIRVYWDPARAGRNSPSLHRAIEAMRRFS